jgi:lipopolysaccharide export system protein LptA
MSAAAIPKPAQNPLWWLSSGLLLLAAAVIAEPAGAQSVDQLRERDEPLEINATEGIEWNRNDKTYIARGNARAASGDVEVLADVLTAYYRERGETTANSDSAFSQGGDSEIYLLEASGNVRINSPEGTVYGDKGQYKLLEKVFVMTGKDLRLISKEDVVTARDSLEYWEGERKAVARGKAHATHEDKQIKADVLTANFEENAQGNLAVHRIDAVGNVEIQTAKEYARGRKGVYFVNQERAELEGDVKITQGENQLNGNYAEVDMQSGISKLLSARPGTKAPTDSSAPTERVNAVVLPRATKKDAPTEGEKAPAATPPAGESTKGTGGGS